MSFFSGMAAGFGEAQGQYNSKMLDFLNEKSKTMAQLYGHLADTAQDPSLQTEFTNRALGWSTANPIMDPKGYKALVQQEKTGLHDMVDSAHQQKVADYHQQTFGTQAPTPAAQGQSQASAPQAQSQASAPQAQSQPAPQAIPFRRPGVPESPEGGTGPAGGVMAPPQVQAPPVSNQAAGMQPQATMPGQGQAPAPMPLSMQPPTQMPSISDYVKGVVGPEPPAYSGVGRETLEHQIWRDAYMKRLEQTVPTPQGMQQFIGAPYMPSGFASPIATMMSREWQANARAAASGYKMVNGQAIPMSQDELSLSAQVKMQKDNVNAQLQAATIPLRQAMIQFYSGKTQLLPVELKVRLAQLGMEQEHLRLAELNTNAQLFGKDLNGNPIPGSVVMPDGTVVGQRFAHNVLPSGQTITKAETAIPVMGMGDKLLQFTQDPNNAEMLGIVKGNLLDWMAKGKNITSNPREGELRADLISMASLMVPLHGFRSQRAAEEFMARLSQGQTPEQFLHSLNAFNSVGQMLYDTGMPNLVSGGGKTVPRISNPHTVDGSGGKGQITPAQVQAYIRQAGGDPTQPMDKIPAAVRRHAMELAVKDGWTVK